MKIGGIGGKTKLIGASYGENWNGNEAAHAIAMRGDSGGPLFVTMLDGTWRLLGIQHGGGTQEDEFEAVPIWIHWIESVAEQDLTPCHDRINGRWRYTGDAETCVGKMVYYPQGRGRTWSDGADCQPPTVFYEKIFYQGGERCAGWPVGGPRSSTTAASSRALGRARATIHEIEGAGYSLTCESIDDLIDEEIQDTVRNLIFDEEELSWSEEDLSDTMEALDCH